MPDFPLPHRILTNQEGPQPAPALLLLHGRGADESDLLPLAEALDPRLFTIALRGPLAFPFGGHAWYELDPSGVGFPDPQSLEHSLALLDEVLDRALAAYPIDPARVYATGFSMGSVMAGTMALLWPHRVAGAAILSGYLPLHAGLPFDPRDAAGHPIFQAHGTLDAVIPVSFGRETAAYLASTPVDLTYREYPMGHQISPQEFNDLAAWCTRILDAPVPHEGA